MPGAADWRDKDLAEAEWPKKENHTETGGGKALIDAPGPGLSGSGFKIY